MANLEVLKTIDKHAPRRIRTVGKKKSPWLRRLIFKRDYLTKKATTSGDPSVWHLYKQFRKLLKIAADVVAPSLTEIFIQSINTGIFPYEWKEARVSPYTNTALNLMQVTTGQYR